MKFKIVFFFAALLAISCNNSTDEKKQDTIKSKAISMKGSDTVLPLAQRFAETFKKINQDLNISVTGGGSGVGITALEEGTTIIAMSSRELSTAEKLKLMELKKEYKEIIIAKDALAVVNHPSNKVNQLTKNQIRDIYTGKITNWKEVGGDDMKIVVYSRESSSGTYEFFKEHEMDQQNYATSVLNMPASGAIIQSVSQTKGAIGYVGLAYLNADVQDIKVSIDEGKTFVAASIENAINKTYPISRPLFYYYLSKDEELIKPYLDFVMSAEGQALVKKEGYVPVK
jgi:phosphate transport system substrate-binding protein